MAIAAAIQMNSTIEVPQNLDSAYELLARAQQQQAVFAVLPENFAIMAKHERERLAVAETPGEGPIQAFLAATARELRLWIVAGTIPLRIEGEARVAAASVVYDDAGVCVARYDKIHLFDVDVPGGDERHRESASMAPGSVPTRVATPVGNLGLSVCYDVRFPELYRKYSAEGAQLLTVPAAFTVPTGRAHWELLLRARAVENLCYVVAAAQTGKHQNGRETYGHSMIVDPWGEILQVLPEGTGVVTAQIDLTSQLELRTRFPALSHRRV